VGAVTIGTLFALLTALGIAANPFASSDTFVSNSPGVTSETDQQVQLGPDTVPATSSDASAPTSASQLRVANTGGTGAYIRRTPNMNDRIRAWTDGTILKVVGPDLTQNGIEWKHVQDPAGNDGWIPAQYVTAS
jgi:hypothetical protein